MRFDRGSLTIAGSAVLVAAVVGAGVGAKAGAISAVGTMTSGALLQLALTRRASNADRATRLEQADRTYALPAAVLEGGVARYLRPEAEVVPFWPRAELGELTGWVASSWHVAVQLVTGPGGIGKTRLALQLAERIAENGWRVRWVKAGTEQTVARAVRDVGEPALLVVDYAETRAGLLGLLADVTRDDGPDIRVLLIARSAGEWWQQLINSSDYQLSEQLAAVQPITLGPVSEASRQPEVFDAALAAFAGALRLPCPDAKPRLADPGAVVLAVHAAALLAVLDQCSSGHVARAPKRMADALRGLLRHEERYWEQSQAARNLELELELARRVVAAGCLVGADSEAAASKLLAVIPDLADSAQRRGQVARWLHDLYPVPEAVPAQKEPREWIGPLQPDLIGEQLVVSVLTRQPDLVPALFTGLTGKRATRALTVLARAALTEPAASEQLGVALNSDLEHLAVPALEVAVTTNTAVADLLKNALVSSNYPSHLLKRMAGAIKYPSVTLAETAVVVFHRLAEGSTGDMKQRAISLTSLSTWLSLLGHREDALAAMEEAVIFFRAQAKARPNAFLPDLAASLNNLSNRLSDLGRREDALAAIGEAIGLLRRLVKGRRNAFLPELAMSLNNQSGRLSDLGRHREALAAARETVAIRSALSRNRPTEYLPDLASSLRTLSNCLSDIGRPQEALAAIEETIAIQRIQVKMRPDAFLNELAKSLNNLSNRLSDLGRMDEALLASEEGVTINRALAEARPGAFLPSLAMSLNQLSNARSELGHRLSDVGRYLEALAASQEAVTLYRALAEAQPGAFLPNLAMSLHTLSNRLSDLRRRDDALAASQEAVTLYRALAEAQPGAFLPNLAMSLSSLSGRLFDVGRRSEALAASEEAVTLYRALAEDRPDAMLPNLAKSLAILAVSLASLNRQPEADAARAEAARLGLVP